MEKDELIPLNSFKIFYSVHTPMAQWQAPGWLNSLR